MKKLFFLMVFLAFTQVMFAQKPYTNTNNQTEMNVEILAGETKTEPIMLNYNRKIVQIKIPDTFTGTQISFETCITGYPNSPMKVNGELYTIDVTAGDVLQLDMSVFFFVKYLRIVSNATEAATRKLQLQLY